MRSRTQLRRCWPGSFTPGKWRPSVQLLEIQCWAGGAGGEGLCFGKWLMQIMHLHFCLSASVLSFFSSSSILKACLRPRPSSSL